MAHMKYNSYESIRDLYYKYFTSNSPYEDVGFESNEGDKFSFSLQNYLYFYIEMHKLSGSSEWVTLMEDTCNHILDNTDERRVEKGGLVITPLESPATETNYFQAPYPYQVEGTPAPGWGSFDGSEQPRLRVQVLQDGQIAGALCTVAHYIIENSIIATEGFADSLLAHSRRVINSHDNSYRYDTIIREQFVKGTYKYPERINGNDSVYGDAVPYNHCAGILKAALICNYYEPDAEYVNKAQSFMDFTRDTRVDVGDRFEWDYTLKNPGKSEDVNHGSYSLTMFYQAYKLGRLGITKEEMTKYTNSMINANKWPRVKKAYEKVNATEDMPSGEVFDIGKMAYFKEFNKNIAYFGRDLASSNYIAKFPSHFRAIATLLNNLEDYEL